MPTLSDAQAGRLLREWVEGCKIAVGLELRRSVCNSLFAFELWCSARGRVDHLQQLAVGGWRRSGGRRERRDA
jgi:hypothetical protein